MFVAYLAVYARESPVVPSRVDLRALAAVALSFRTVSLVRGGVRTAVRSSSSEPLFATIAPGLDAAPRSVGREGPPATEELGYLHCGPAGAGHFVKMVHNGIEYGLMESYAEGLNLLAHADAGTVDQVHDAETTPLRDPVAYRYEYADGLRATMLQLNGLVQDFTLAARLKGRPEPLSTLFHLPPNPNVVYSAALMLAWTVATRSSTAACSASASWRRSSSFVSRSRP